MRRLFDIIQIGEGKDIPSITFDYLLTACIVSNIISMILLTFDSMQPYYHNLEAIEVTTTYLFITEYIARVVTAKYLYPEENIFKATLMFVFSVYGMVDLLSILPILLTGILPYGFSVLRMLRVFRILRLFKITKNYDSFSVIGTVVKNKRKQILSSVFIILLLMLSASVIIYGFEHDVQPDKFENALSGLWWAVNTMLTVGYGDIYPMTIGGKLFTVFVEFLGVGLVAIPTGILSAGFMEYHSEPVRKTTNDITKEIQALLDESWDKEQTLDELINKMKKLKL